jgi:hypothetical protein
MIFDTTGIILCTAALLLFILAIVAWYLESKWDREKMGHSLDMEALRIKMKEREIIHDNLRQGAYLPKREINNIPQYEEDDDDDDLDEIEDLRYR